MYLQINTVKYKAYREIMNIYKNLQIVQSQFFTDMLLFVYIQSTSNIYWFISIQIHCQQIAIQLLLTILNIQSAIWWAIKKVILNYSHLLTFFPFRTWSLTWARWLPCSCFAKCSSSSPTDPSSVSWYQSHEMFSLLHLLISWSVCPRPFQSCLG